MKSYYCLGILSICLGVLVGGYIPLYAQDSPHTVITADNIHQLSEVRHLGKGNVRTVAWSPDGRQLAIGGGVGVWIYDSGYEVVTLLEGEVFEVTWLKDNRLLTVNQRTLSIWDVENEVVLDTIEVEGSAIWDVAIASDGLQIAAASGRAVRIFDLEPLTEVQRYDGHSGTVNAVDWSAENGLISADSHGDVIWWDTEVVEASRRDEFGVGIASIRLSPDNSMLAIGFGHESIQVMDTQSNDIIFMADTQSEFLEDLAWASDNIHLATVHFSVEVLIWNIETGELEQRINVASEEAGINYLDAVWTPNSEALMVATRGTVSLYNIETGSKMSSIGEFSVSSRLVHWSPNSQLLAATSIMSPPDDNLAIWNVDTGELVEALSHGEGGMWMWLNDNQTLIYHDLNQPVQDFSIVTLNNGSPPNLPDLSSSTMLMVAPNGTRIAAVDQLNIVQVYDVVTALTLNIDPESPVWIMDWSSTGAILLVDANDGIQFWDGETGEKMYTLVSGFRDFAFSPDDSRLLIAKRDNQFDVWDVEKGELLDTIQTEYNFRFFEWSPQGDLILINRVGGMSFLSTETWEEVHFVEADGMANWSPDGTRIATSGSDGIIRIWGIP